MAIARVQFANGTAVTTSPHSLVVPSTVAGNGIIGCVICYGSSTTFDSISCSGETITKTGTRHQWGPDWTFMEWFYIKSLASGGSKTIQCSFTTAPTRFNAVAWEISGQDTSTFIDASSVGSSATTSTPGTSITTASANAAIFALVASNDGNPTGYQSVYTSEDVSDDWQYQGGQYNVDVGAAGSKSVQFTTNAVGLALFSMIAIKAAAGGGSTVPLTIFTPNQFGFSAGFGR